MSERNGDRARFQKDRKRKLRKRQRIQQFLLGIRAQRSAPVGPVRELVKDVEGPRGENVKPA